MLQARELHLLPVFAAVVRLGSFTAAARELGLSKSVVSDNVRTLEERCGVRLLERSTRRLQLTQVGEQVLGAAADVVSATRNLELILDEHRDRPVGTLRIATTYDLGPRLVVPVAARLAAAHPQLGLDIVTDDRIQDLIGGGFDVAVRLGAPRDSGNVIKRLAQIAEPLVAAPALADALGLLTMGHADELAGAPWIRHPLVSSGATLTLVGPRGEKATVPLSLRAQANSGEGVRALLLSGVGIGALPEYLIAEDLRRGALVRICPAWEWKRVALYAELPSAKRKPRRVQVFLDALKEACAAGTFLEKAQAAR